MQEVGGSIPPGSTIPTLVPRGPRALVGAATGSRAATTATSSPVGTFGRVPLRRPSPGRAGRTPPGSHRAMPTRHCRFDERVRRRFRPFGRKPSANRAPSPFARLPRPGTGLKRAVRPAFSHPSGRDVRDAFDP